MFNVQNQEVKQTVDFLSAVFDELAGKFSDKSSEFFQKASANFSTRTDEISTEMFLSLLAKITISAVIPIASTMGVSYFFKNLTMGLTTPLLAQETRMAHAYDRRKNAFKATIGPSFSAAGTAFFLTSYIPPFKSLLRDASCIIKKNVVGINGYISNKNCYKFPASFKTIAIFSLFCGVVAGGYTGIKNLYNEYRLSIKAQDPLPILNADTAIALERIAKSTCDLKGKESFLQNVLLFGPGGTGKTMAAKAIAKNSDMNFLMMSGGDLPQYIEKGTHVSELNKLFAKIKGFQGSTVLFIDEAESLCRKRSDILTDMKRIELLNAFLNLTGDNSKKIMLVLATNRPQDLDEAVLSRMDHKLHLGPPAFEQRKQIIKMHVERIFEKEELSLFDDKTLVQIASQTEGMTGRAIFKMINALLSNKALEKEGKLTKGLIEEVVKQFKKQEDGIAKKSLYNSLNSHFWSAIRMPL